MYGHGVPSKVTGRTKSLPFIAISSFNHLLPVTVGRTDGENERNHGYMFSKLFYNDLTTNSSLVHRCEHIIIIHNNWVRFILPGL